MWNTTASVGYVCRGSAPIAAFLFTDDNGQNLSGPRARRMGHAAAPEFLPYGSALQPRLRHHPEKRPGTLTLLGDRVRWVDFRGSMAGAYTDSVTVSILPKLLRWVTPFPIPATPPRGSSFSTLPPIRTYVSGKILLARGNGCEGIKRAAGSPGEAVARLCAGGWGFRFPESLMGAR